jgi:hypothetical protein
MVGQSRAFEILESIEFPHDLIVEARDIAGRTGNSPLAKAIQDISKATALKQEAERNLEEAKCMKPGPKSSFTLPGRKKWRAPEVQEAARTARNALPEAGDA